MIKSILRRPISLNVQALAVLLLVFIVAFLGLSSRPLDTDEYYHLLAGKSFMQNGNFAIGDGEYTRGAVYTVMVGVLFEIFDTTHPLLGRVPALVAASLVAPLVFLWVARHWNARAGWIAALLLCFSPDMTVAAEFTRFYTLQVLLIWLAATMVFDALTDQRLGIWKLLTAMTCFGFALHLQVTTLLAIGGLGVFLLLDMARYPRVIALLTRPNHRAAFVLSAVLIAAMAVLLIIKYWHTFHSASLWNESRSNDVAYYARGFLKRYAIFFPLLPAAWIIGFPRAPRMFLLCGVMFLLPFLAHSFGGMKGIRYVLYILPFFCAMWGVLIDIFIAPLRTCVVRAIDTLAVMFNRTADGMQFPMVVPIVTAALILGTTLANRGVRDGVTSAARLALNGIRHPAMLFKAPPNGVWSRHTELATALGTDRPFVTAEAMQTLYYLRPFDLEINRSKISDINPQVEFGIDPRSGHRVIGSGQYVRAVVRCHPSGVFLVTDARWRVQSAVPDDAADAMESMASIDPPQVPGFKIFRWRHVVDNSPACISFRESILVPY